MKLVLMEKDTVIAQLEGEVLGWIRAAIRLLCEDYSSSVGSDEMVSNMKAFAAKMKAN